jgi:hypothetical protein
MEERRETGEGNRSGQRSGLVGENGGILLRWRGIEGRKLKAWVCLEERTRAFERGRRERRWRGRERKVFVVSHDIPFCNGEVPVEDAE